jgi:hypothetical protein
MSSSGTEILTFVESQLAEPEGFRSNLTDRYLEPGPSSDNTVHLADGRVFERYSIPQLIDGEVVGRVWSFRDVTQRAKLEEVSCVSGLP